MTKTVVQTIAGSLQAMKNCQKSGNTEWMEKHEQAILDTVSNYLPSGSGIDTGTTLNLDRSTSDKLVFNFSYHHMNENGFYTHWTDHVLTVRPSFNGLNLSISGRDSNGIKDILYETFDYALSKEVQS